MAAWPGTSHIEQVRPSPVIPCRVLQPDDQARFEALFSLYESALPEQELKTRAQLAQMLAAPGYVFLYAERAAQLVGLAVVYQFHSGALTLLEYLAVAQCERRTGLGSRLFESSAALAAGRTLLVEMDVPSAADLLSQERSRFYQRQGCRRVAGLAYILPLPGKTAPPMWLLALGPRADLERRELSGWLRALYTEVYACVQADPRIELMLAPMPARVQLVELEHRTA